MASLFVRPTVGQLNQCALVRSTNTKLPAHKFRVRFAKMHLFAGVISCLLFALCERAAAKRRSLAATETRQLKAPKRLPKLRRRPLLRGRFLSQLANVCCARAKLEVGVAGEPVEPLAMLNGARVELKGEEFAHTHTHTHSSPGASSLASAPSDDGRKFARTVGRNAPSAALATNYCASLRHLRAIM